MYCRITYIYGLYEVGEDEDIRYIGKSDNPKKRLRDHRNDNRLTSHKSSWVKNVLLRGKDIGMKIIAVVPFENWKKSEVEIIKEYRKKYKLVNLTDGGDGKMENIYNKSLQECKEWLNSNKPDWVIGMKEYKKWSKMNEFPDFLPKAPNRVFIDWQTWGDFLGTGSIHTSRKKEFYLSYEDAKKYLKNNFNFKNSNDFKRTKIPNFIPKKPFKIYEEWKGWEDFIGYTSIRRRGIEYLDYEDAKVWINKNFGKITSKEYREKSKKNEIPIFLPKKPERVYDNFRWSEFLSHNGRKKNKEFYLTYEESVEIVHKLNIKTNAEWRRWCKTKPNELIRIPSSPETVYKSKWTNWFDWLGSRPLR